MKTDSVHIVGGGIVGLCTSLYLAQKGVEVTIIDAGDYSKGTSFGNAGMIVPSHFIPMATPGVISQGLKWLLNSKSPFYVKPRFDIDLLKWLWHFKHSATDVKVSKSIPVLYAFNEWSKVLYRSIAKDLDFGFEERGLLMLYKTAKQAFEEKELAEKAAGLGMAVELLNSNELKRLEPDMDLDVLGGVYFPGDAHLYPNRLMKQLIIKLKELGVRFVPNTTIIDFKTQGSRVSALVGKEGRTIPAENVILAAGCWTADLLKKAAVKIHLQAGKGYSITMSDFRLRPRIPTILSEAKVAITPMGEDIRIGGTLELGDASAKVNTSRVQGIVESIPKYYKNLNIPFENSTKIWQGYRPCTPDGMPYIGKSESLSNLLVGTGHGMMGLSLGAATGKLLSELLIGENPTINVQPFRLNRF